MIDVVCDSDKVQPAIAATLADLADVCAHGIDADRLNRAKTQMRWPGSSSCRPPRTSPPRWPRIISRRAMRIFRIITSIASPP
jgi:hypothetical protein